MSGTETRSVSRELLAGVVDTLEAAHRGRGGYNCYLARYAGDACRLLGFTSEELRTQNLLSTLTARKYWAGAITNTDTTKLPDGARQLSSLEKIAQAHPVFPDNYAQSTLRRFGDHLAFCADRDYERAFASARSELTKEEIILAQALMGDYALAEDSLPRLSDSYRRRNVILVVTIELYRYGRASEAELYRQRLPRESLLDWDGAHLAVGASNHIPWQVYPFPDY